MFSAADRRSSSLRLTAAEMQRVLSNTSCMKNNTLNKALKKIQLFPSIRFFTDSLFSYSVFKYIEKNNFVTNTNFCTYFKKIIQVFHYLTCLGELK